MNETRIGRATNTADECAWTASQLSTVVATTQPGEDLTPPINMTAMDAFTSATANGGFQIVALIATSKGAVAAVTTTASASRTDSNRLLSATNSAASATDWMTERPIPPACGR